MPVKIRLGPCLLAAAFVAFIFIPACNQQKSPDELRQQAAKQTAQFKQDAKAVAQGVREGWNRDAAVKSINLNTAPKDQLTTLPGITPAQADRIIAGRPYNASNDVVTKRVMSKTEYDKISDRITAQK